MASSRGLFSAVGGLMGGLMRGGALPRVTPFKEAGTSGTAIYGGFLETKERNPKVTGEQKFVTYSDMMANVSIIAAGLRFFLNLTSRPSWKVEPAKDLPDGKSSDRAKAAAEFVEHVKNDLDANWTRIIRRSGMYRFDGFGIHEWTAKRRPDGLIGMESIEVRPAYTIERWDTEESGSILGVMQRSPQTSEELWIPRKKFIYLLDDTLTDSPAGMGIFRQLVDPAERIQALLKLEGQGYERDLRGIPVGHAPIGEINAAVEGGVLTKEQGQSMIDGLKRFLSMQAKSQDTGLLLDSATYEGQSQDGITVSGSKKWDMSLLNAGGSGFADIGRAIERLRYDMAIIIGVENLLIGSGNSGSRALSEDKSKNLTLQANACVGDMTEAYNRDFIGAIWALNGLPDELKPSFTVEDVSFKDAEQVAKVLNEMSTAGAILAPDDPVIDEVRDLLGVARQPEMTPDRMALINPAPIYVQPQQTNAPARTSGAKQAAAGGDDGQQPGPGDTPTPDKKDPA